MIQMYTYWYCTCVHVFVCVCIVCVFEMSLSCLFHLEQAGDKNALKQEAASPQGK